MISDPSRREEVAFTAHRQWHPNPFSLFPIEVFVDATHVDHNLHELGYGEMDRSALIEAVVRWFTKRLQLPFWGNPFWRRARSSGTVPRKPVAYCRSVWCVTSTPENVHHDDRSRARKRLEKACIRWGEDGFHLEAFPSDFCGYHLLEEDRLLSKDENERSWSPKEKFVDVALATLLVTRGKSPDRPSGIVLLCGDGDLAPALWQVHKDNPKIQLGVAGFTGRFSEVYKGKGLLHYNWKLRCLDLTSMLGNIQRGESRLAA